MRLPAYLALSRHGIFYFRYPLPKALHARTEAVTIRFSLGTREPGQALRLALALRYVAGQLTRHASGHQMQLDEIRTLFREHFTRMLEAQKQDIRDNGRLSDLVVHSFEATAAQQFDTSTSFRERTAVNALFDFEIEQILTSAGATSEMPDSLRGSVRTELRLANAAYAQAVLQYNRQYDGYDFTAPVAAVSTASPTPANCTTSLSALVTEFVKYSRLEKRWIDKTEGEKQEHIDLLYEILGKDVPALSIGRTEARKVRDTLIAFPVNRHKDQRTRGKPLDEVLAMPGLRTLHVLTINKYMQTYKGLFNWAKLNGYCEDNPFSGLSLRIDRANADEPRLPFPDEALASIRQAVQASERNIHDHHRWGTLIAMYSGARLNEVAQLHLDDVRHIDGIHCFDINQNGPTKKLKNRASKRVVPIHPRLIELGFLHYVDSVRAISGNERMFPQLTFTKSDGYGRNLGRWFNEALLPTLGIKTKQLTFHSLRHTFIKKLVAADVSQAHIMAIVGHEPGTTTLKTYNREGFPPQQLLAALEKVT